MLIRSLSELTSLRRPSPSLLVVTQKHPEPSVSAASEDPYIIQAVGRLQVDLHAATEVLKEAGALLDEIAAAPVTAASSARASGANGASRRLGSESLAGAIDSWFPIPIPIRKCTKRSERGLCEKVS